MSCPDSIHCKMPLPEAPEHVKRCPVFQTSDLGNNLGEYTITEDGKLVLNNCAMGRLLMQSLGAPNDYEPQPILVEYVRKRIEMFASNMLGSATREGKRIVYTDDGSDRIDITYVVQIRNSKVSSIKEKCRTVTPARPISEM